MLLHCKRDELRKLWIEGIEHKHVLNLLDEIEDIKQVPQKLEACMASKHYLHATDMLVGPCVCVRERESGMFLRDLWAVGSFRVGSSVVLPGIGTSNILFTTCSPDEAFSYVIAPPVGSCLLCVSSLSTCPPVTAVRCHRPPPPPLSSSLPSQYDYQNTHPYSFSRPYLITRLLFQAASLSAC